MKRNKIILVALILSMTALLFTGCWLTPLSPDNEPLETIIPETTIVLEGEANGQIFSVTEDHSIITFSESTPQLEELAPGHILAMGVTEKTPEGLLRRITKISKGGRDNNQVIVETEPTTLEEAIDQGEFCFNESLNVEDAKDPVCYVKGIEFVRDRSTIKDSKAQILEFNYKINTIIYDGDSNPNTKEDNIVLNGQISFNYDLLFSCKIKFPNKLKKLDFENIVHLEKNIGVTLGDSVKLFSYEKTLWSQSLGTKVIMVGCIPIVLSPKITIVANVKGEIFAEVTAEVTDKDIYTVGIKYDNGSWQPISSHENYSSPPSLSLSAGGEVTFGVGPKLDCKIEGVLGPYIEVLVYGKAMADISLDPWWEIYAGILAKAGIKIEIFSKQLASTELIILDLQKLIKEADGPFGGGNHPPVIASSPVTSTTKDEPYSYDVNATDIDGDTLVYSLTANPSGMTINSSTGLIAWTPTTSGDFDVTVKVSDGELTGTQSFTITVEDNSTYNIRDIGPAGGYIFYDKGSFSDGWRYLEAAPSDQSTDAPWGCYRTEILGVDGTAVGTGKQNTIDIEAGCTTAGTAADICANLSLGGYDDWFLPSKDEMYLMYKNLEAYGVGGFNGLTYWSSSEFDAYLAWHQSFLGDQYCNYKYNSLLVRAVRAF